MKATSISDPVDDTGGGICAAERHDESLCAIERCRSKVSAASSDTTSTIARYTDAEKKRYRKDMAEKTKQQLREREMKDLKAQLDAARQEVAVLRVEAAKKSEVEQENELLKKQIQQGRLQKQEQQLRNLIVLGHIKHERRERGVASDDEGDDEFVGQSSRNSSYSTDEQVESENGTEDEPSTDEQVESGNGTEDEPDEKELDQPGAPPLSHEPSGISTSSEQFSDASPVLLALQTQIEALEALLAHQQFVTSCDRDTLHHLEGLLLRSREACGVANGNLCGDTVAKADEIALLKWRDILQRATTKAVGAHQEAINFRFVEVLSSEECRRVEPATVWKALALDYRRERMRTLS